MVQGTRAEDKDAPEFYPGFWWKFLAVALAGNVLHRAQAHLKGHPLTVALFAGAALYLVVAVLRDARARDYPRLWANLLCLAGSVCFALGYAHPAVNFWLAFAGYAGFLASFLSQYLRWKWDARREPPDAPPQ